MKTRFHNGTGVLWSMLSSLLKKDLSINVEPAFRHSSDVTERLGRNNERIFKTLFTDIESTYNKRTRTRFDWRKWKFQKQHIFNDKETQEQADKFESAYLSDLKKDELSFLIFTKFLRIKATCKWLYFFSSQTFKHNF